MTIVRHNKKGSLIVVSGPSGVGKDTICNEIVNNNEKVWMSISTTTREPRVGEVEGINYYFVSKEAFEDKINAGDFLEYAVVHSGHYYGTLKRTIIEKLDLGYDVILNIDIQGAINIGKETDDAIFIFIMPPTMEILKQRLIDRATETEDKVLERFKTAYKEINEFKKYNYVVVNDKLSDAVKKVDSILLSEKCRVDRIEQLDLDNKEELIHETLVH